MPASASSRSTRGSRRGSRFRRIVAGLAALVLLGLLAAWIVGGRLIAASPRAIGDPPPDLRATSLSIPSDSGSVLAGWHLDADARQGVVVLLHPIRTSRLFMLERARLLHGAGYAVVMIDLQAHGESPGERITLGRLERHDVRAAVEWARRAHPGAPVAVVGVSLGGAAAVLAGPLDIDALVLESVFPSIETAVHNRVAARLGPLASVPAELLLMQLGPRLGVAASELRPLDALAAVGCPVLIMSGREDRHTTADDTRAMFAAAPPPKDLWLVPGAAHEDLYAASPREYEVRLLDFLARHLQGGR